MDQLEADWGRMQEWKGKVDQFMGVHSGRLLVVEQQLGQVKERLGKGREESQVSHPEMSKELEHKVLGAVHEILEKQEERMKLRR